MDIEPTVLSLIGRLEKEEGKIDQYVKDKIQVALNFYLQEVSRRSSRISQSQVVNIQNLISEAKYKLHILPCLNNGHQILPKNDKEIPLLKEYLFGLEKSINSGKIKPDDYKTVLNDAISWGIHIENSNKRFTENQLPSVAIIFLKLFINSPNTKVTANLDEILYSLHTSLNQIYSLNVQNVEIADAERVRGQVGRIQEALKFLDKVANEMQNDLEQKIRSYDPSVLLNTIANELKTFYWDVENLQVPIQENALKMYKERLSDLINVRIPNVRYKNDETENVKKQLTEQASTIREDLKKMNAKYLSLNESEHASSQILAKHDEFDNKKINLETLIKQIRSIETINKAVNARKDKLINKISGFIVAEGMIYLRHKSDTIEDYKSYAKQFAFPQNIQMYDIKFNEISSLKDPLLKLSIKDNDLFQRRIQTILDQIQEVLTLLETRANENEQTRKKLQRLESIETEISDHMKKPQIKINILNNDFRSRIENVEGFTYRIVKKKMEVLKLLHSFEKNVFGSEFPEIVEHVTKLLDKYENSTRQLNEAIFDENSVLEKEKLSGMWSEMKSKVQSMGQTRNIKFLFPVLQQLFKQIDQSLSKQIELNIWIDRMNRIDQTLDELEIRNVSEEEKTTKIKKLSEKIDSYQKQIRRNDLLNRLSRLEVRIAIEDSKIRTTTNFKADLSRLQGDLRDLNHPMTNKIFLDRINNILRLKEIVKDMPEGDQELDNFKRSALDELYSTMNRLDKDVAKHAFKKKQSENVLNVDSYFDKLDTKDIANKEHVDFVHRICAHAKGFQERINCYFGSRDSIDYYVIDESLMTLLEELDKLKCDDEDLLNETTKAMAYIKGMKRQLLANASPSE